MIHDFEKDVEREMTNQEAKNKTIEEAYKLYNLKHK